jgi:hypothetical protein
VATAKFCFLQDTSDCTACCAQKHRQEEPNCAPAQALVVFFYCFSQTEQNIQKQKITQTHCSINISKKLPKHMFQIEKTVFTQQNLLGPGGKRQQDPASQLHHALTTHIHYTILRRVANTFQEPSEWTLYNAPKP